MADVTVHIDEKLEHDALARIVDSLRALDGIGSVISHDGRPHMLVVGYDPDRTSAKAVHDHVVAQGVHAEMIGM